MERETCFTSRFTRAGDVQIVIPLRRIDEDSETQTCTDAREHDERGAEERGKRSGGPHWSCVLAVLVAMFLHTHVGQERTERELTFGYR